MSIGDMGIDLGCTNITMTEERLDRAKVGAIHEKVGGEAMTEGVRGDMLRDAGHMSVFFDNTFNRARSETAVIAIRTGETGVF